MSYNNIVVHLVLDTGATASLIKQSKCTELNIPIKPTAHKAVQIDGTDLSVVGEIHVPFRRDSVNLHFSALVVTEMCCDILAGTGFHKENDVYSRMATDKIVVQGKYFFNSTSPLALSAKIEAYSMTAGASDINEAQVVKHAYPVLIKATKSATFLPGEGFSVPIRIKLGGNQLVSVEPRKEAPVGFVSDHLQEVENGTIFIRNMSAEPIKVKKNTPLCQIRETREVKTFTKNVPPAAKLEPSVDLEVIKLDPSNQFTPEEQHHLKQLLESHKEIFRSDLPGYNHHYGRVEATFQWASKARPPANRARMPDYNAKGNELFNAKAAELHVLGVLKKASEMDIQPAFKNNSFLVKKQAATSKTWDECTLKDVRMVTAFSQLQKYIQTIPAKVTRRDKILQMCANWKYMAELDMTNMFFQIPLKQSSSGDIKKLSYLCIQTDEGTFVYVRSPQGLPGISEYEEELTDTVFGDMVIQGKVVKYADNIYTGGSTKQKFLTTFSEVIERLYKSNLRINPSKLIIGIKETTIMGWNWNQGTLTPSVHKLNPLALCEEPQTITGLRSFLGGMRIHKRCLQGVDNFSKPLDEACPSNQSGKLKIEWTPDMREAFKKCQEVMKSPKAVVVPRTSDQLVQVGDGALSLPATGTVLVAIREGIDGCLPVCYFGFRVKGSMLNWSACEIEAYTHATAMEENSIYFRESDKPAICLSDSSPVVDAAKKIKRGLYSASPRLQTFVTAVQRYGGDFVHISGKLPTTLIDIADFCSRNPIECKEPNCKVCQLSEDPDTSYATVRFSNLISSNQLEITSRTAWKRIQESSPELKRGMSQIQSGTKPSKKEKNVTGVRKMISKGTISKDGLLVFKNQLPMELKPVEQIVVPKEYSISILTLLHNDKRFDHPSAHQMEEITKRNFFIFDRKKLCQEVFTNCIQCQAGKKISPNMLNFEVQTKSEHAGTFFNADVIQRNTQKILLLRDNLTSFTQTKFVENEQKDTLREGLICLIYRIKPNMKIIVRVDPHSSFKALENDKILAECDIQLDLGDEKNKNKNGVAEKGIQELHEEIVKISTETKLSEIELAKATDSLNSRIRFSKRSSKELWMKRNQYTGDDLEVDDMKLSDDQLSRRINDNKAKQKLPSKEPLDFIKGEIVFIISDKDKTKRREPYLITKISNTDVQVVKLKKGSKGVRYNVKKENLYKANDKLSREIREAHHDSTEDEEEEMVTDKNEGRKVINNQRQCFLCKRAKYLDFFHPSDSCNRFHTKLNHFSPPTKRESSDSEDSSSEEIANHTDSDNLIEFSFEEASDDAIQSSEQEEEHQQLIDRSHLLSIATSISLPSSNEDDFSSTCSEDVSENNPTNDDDVSSNSNDDNNYEDDHVLNRDTLRNPSTLPDPGDTIEFFDPNLGSRVNAIVTEMDRRSQARWPGWRNIAPENSRTESSVNLDIFSTNCVAWRYTQFQPDPLNDVEVARDAPQDLLNNSLRPTPDISVEEPDYEEDGFDNMQLLSMEENMKPDEVSTPERAPEETDDETFEKEIDEAFYFLNTAFTVSHHNLGLPPNMQIEANRVYNLTEALNIEIPIQSNFVNSRTYLVESRPEYHLLQRRNPLTDLEQQPARTFKFLPKFVRKMKIFQKKT